MKISNAQISFEITDVHPNDYFLMVSIMTKMYDLLNNVKLDSLADEQDKNMLLKRLKAINDILVEHTGTKRAESYDETLINKVIHKIAD